MENTEKKEYLITYYFTNGEVHAIRYKIETNMDEYKNKEGFLKMLLAVNGNEQLILNDDCSEVVNLDQVCRLTIDEIESEENDVYK